MSDINKKDRRDMLRSEYDAAMDLKVKRGLRALKYSLILLGLFAVQAIIWLVIIEVAKSYHVRYLIIVGIFWALLLLFILIKSLITSLRCPKCRRFFPKGKRELFDHYQGSEFGENYFRRSETHVYLTKCKYCGHNIWIIK